MSGAFGLALTVAVVCLSAGARRRQVARLRRAPEPVETPFSRALAEVVGMAGGIYLSLVMLASFLKLQVPEQVSLWGTRMDPLAVASLVLAVLQPLAGAFRRS